MQPAPAVTVIRHRQASIHCIAGQSAILHFKCQLATSTSKAALSGFRDSHGNGSRRAVCPCWRGYTSYAGACLTASIRRLAGVLPCVQVQTRRGSLFIAAASGVKKPNELGWVGCLGLGISNRKTLPDTLARAAMPLAWLGLSGLALIRWAGAAILALLSLCARFPYLLRPFQRGE